MKPIYLNINFFGPHEHSTIDFRKLDESPIFLIGGDTGAGKSTIFDAMTFALFGSTTSEREAKEMRSQFAEGTDTTKVVFYFEQNGKIFKVERTPEQFLARKRGTGFTKKAPTANLSIVDEINGVEVESIATKPVDVGNAISEILNLTADQFKKIILLPQNDFSEFLKSNTADKEKILKKIFGTQLFTDFTIKLKDHYDQATSKAQDFDTKIQNQLSSPIWNDEEKAQLKDIDNDQLNDTLAKFVANRQATLNEAKKTEQAKLAAKKKSDTTYQAALDISKKFDQLNEYQTQYKSHITDQADNISQKQVHISELQWAQPLQETVRDLERLEKDQTDTLNSKKDLEQKLQLAHKNLTAAQAKTTELTNQQADFDEKNQQAQKLTVLITKVQEIEAIKKSLSQLQPRLEQITKTVQTKSQELTTINNSIQAKNEELSKYQDFPSQKDKLVQERADFIDQFSPLETDRQNAADAVAKTQKKLKQLHADLDQKTKAFEDAKKDYQEKIKTRQSLMIAQLRQELVDGEACAVCGSTEHPYAKKAAVADEKELRKSMDAVDNSQKVFAAKETDLKNIQQTIQEVSDEFDQQQQKAVSTQIALSTHYTQAVANTSIELPQQFDLTAIKDTFKKNIDQLNEQIQISQKLAQEIKDLENKLSRQQQLLNQDKSELDKLTAQVQTRETDLQTKSADLSDSTTTSQQLITQKNELVSAYEKFQKDLKSAQDAVHKNEINYSNNQTKLTDTQAQLDKLTTNLRNLSDKLHQALNADNAKTNDRNLLDRWILELSQNQLNKLQNDVTSYQKEKEILTSDISKVTAQLKDQTKPDIVALKHAKDEAEQNHLIAAKQTDSFNRDLKEATQNFEQVQKILQAQGNFTKELAAVTSLYNIVTGKDGNENKLKLETYVVQNYLLKILNYANRKFLSILSNDRYYFQLSTESTNKQRDHGLDINIYDRQTNATRSSDTLSGGETFIAALSIALSLSEVVQSSANGVQIDALFIDEGFGSLDEETLNEAMKALTEIGQNRMVGVISHIESMKQSIGQQLLVQKVGNGKSTIKIITK